jgi:integrase/recombinase XerD
VRKEKLYLRFRQPDGKQSPYCPAVFDSKSRLRPFRCLVHGTEELHPEATYYRRVKRAGKWAWESLGTDPHTAWCRANIPVSVVAEPQPEKATIKKDAFRLDDEIKIYLGNVEKLAPKTYKSYRESLVLFQESCTKIYVHQVTKQDLQAYDTFLMQRGNCDRTRHNRAGHVVTFLRNKEGRRLGPEIKDVSIRIRFVEKEPEPFTREELENLFRVSSEENKMLWRFLLGTGFRKDEAAHAEYSDINLEKKLIQVVEKTYFGFKPKNCTKRTVPISDELIAQLQMRKNGSSLIFPTAGGRPDGHLLQRLKDTTFKGGLNCGRCVGRENKLEVSCADAAVCERWIMHRFRGNFASDRHQAGASARQIQKWLSHTSLETTLRYLGAADDTSEQVRLLCNTVYAGL